MITTEVPSSITVSVVQRAFVRTRLIWQFYILAGLCSFVASSLGPMMPFLRGELNLNYTVMAYHFSAFALGVLISGSIGERVMQLLGRKKAMWSGLAGVAIGVATLLLGQNPAMTIFGIWLAGMCASIFGQVIDTVIAEQLGEQRTIAITETNIVTSICATIAPAAVGLFVATGLNWRAPLAILILFIGGAYLYFGRDRIPESAESFETQSHGNGRLPKAYWAYWLVILLGCASEWSIVFWSPDFLQNVAKMAKPEASTAVSAFFVAMMAGRILGSRLARTYSIRALLPAAAVFSLAGFLVFWLAPHSAINVVGLFLAGLGVANMYPLTLSAALGVVPEQVGLGASRMNMATGAAGLCAPLILGGIADRAGIFCAYGVVAVMLALAVGAVFWANKLAHHHHNSAAIN